MQPTIFFTGVFVSVSRKDKIRVRNHTAKIV
jgi:hypothetical protein